MAWCLPSPWCARVACSAILVHVAHLHVLFLVVFSVVLWAVHGTARDMFAAVKKIMRVVIERCAM